MSYAFIKTDGKIPSLREIRVNGRFLQFAHRIETLRRDRKGFFSGTANGMPFEIFGGRHAGGTSRDWFVSWEPLTLGNPSMHVRSLREAIETIENC